jgi:hypothetical protein
MIENLAKGEYSYESGIKSSNEGQLTNYSKSRQMRVKLWIRNLNDQMKEST